MNEFNAQVTTIKQNLRGGRHLYQHFGLNKMLILRRNHRGLEIKYWSNLDSSSIKLDIASTLISSHFAYLHLHQYSGLEKMFILRRNHRGL